MATDIQSGAPEAALADKPKGLGFWIILGLLFFIPYGFVTAEFRSAWPDEGGIYVWIKDAFGPGGGTIVSLLIGWWLYCQASRKAEA